MKNLTEPAYNSALSKPSPAVNGLQPIHNVAIPVIAADNAKPMA